MSHKLEWAWGKKNGTFDISYAEVSVGGGIDSYHVLKLSCADAAEVAHELAAYLRITSELTSSAAQDLGIAIENASDD